MLPCAAVAALALTVLSLAGLSLERTPAAGAARANLAELRSFWAASGAAWAALSVLWWRLARRGPGGASFARAALVVLAVAGGARVAVLVGHDPALSDDVYRYALDGRTLAAGRNPHLASPEERLDALASGAPARFPGEPALLARVNNPELHTIYLPASQWTFAAIALVLPAGVTDPGAVALACRAGLTAIEMLAIVLLLLLLRRAGRSAWWAALYAWHPLPLAEIAGSGHQDAVGIALLLAALLVHARRPEAAVRWTAPVALASLVKPVAAAAALFMLRGRGARAWWRCAAAAAITALLAAGPLLLAHGLAPLRTLASTAGRFTLKWAHFGGAYELLLWLIERAAPAWSGDARERAARALCALALGAVLAVLWRRERRAVAACAAMLFAMVVLSPAAHPWYLLWPLVLLPLAPHPAVWIASLTLPWGYAALADPRAWTVPAPLLVIAWAPVYAALLWRGAAVGRYAAAGERGADG